MGGSPSRRDPVQRSVLMEHGVPVNIGVISRCTAANDPNEMCKRTRRSPETVSGRALASKVGPVNGDSGTI